MLRIKSLDYQNYTWQITTTCDKFRAVTYGELKRELADSDGMVKDVEGFDKPMPFDEFLFLLSLDKNQAQLWYRLELIMNYNEKKRNLALGVAAILAPACIEHHPEIKRELDKHENAQYHDHIERMQQQLDNQNNAA